MNVQYNFLQVFMFWYRHNTIHTGSFTDFIHSKPGIERVSFEATTWFNSVSAIRKFRPHMLDKHLPLPSHACTMPRTR
jgi:hypothetical protein